MAAAIWAIRGATRTPARPSGSAPKGLDVAQGSIDLRVGGRWMVVMLHEGHLTEQSRDGHEEGWSSCFDRLEEMFA